MPAVDFNNNTYYTISEGRICTQHKTPIEGSISRVNKNGKTVYETFHSALKGRITNISVRDTEYGKFWSIELNENEILQIQYTSGYADSFLKTIPNIDLSEEVLLSPKLEIDGDKKRGTLFVRQFDKPVKRYYTKEIPNGIPPLRKVKFQGKEVWDSTEIMEFLENMVKEKMLEAYSKKHNAAPVSTAVDNDGEDDMPF